MGLDLVELVIEVETAFGITIQDEDAPKLITVGQLYDYVLGKLPAHEANRCLSPAVFYQLRRTLTDRFGVDRKEIRPSTPIGRIVPQRRRRSDWEHVARRLDWRLPPLVRPDWMKFALAGMIACWMGAVVAVWEWTSALHLSGMPLAFATNLCGTILLAWIGYVSTKPFANRFPRDCLTVRGAVRAILVLNYGKLTARGGPNRQEVWECLRAIIVKQLAVAPDKVAESAEFVRDLGAD